jgi:peptidoglycan/LPS O-acetylase OafA/YrhL
VTSRTAAHARFASCRSTSFAPPRLHSSSDRICRHPPLPCPLGWTAFFLFWKRFGWTGVDLFFVLSGFLVSGLLFREYATTGAIRPGRFLIRRGLKIYPAFYVLFVVTLVVRHELAIPTGVWATIGEAAFLQNYHYGLWGHTWSLAVEEHFYILLVVALTSIVAVSRSPFRVLERIFIAVPIVVLGLRIATHVLLPFQHHTHHWPTHCASIRSCSAYRSRTWST